MNEYGQFRSLSGHSLYQKPPNYEKNEITLTGDSFDRWFDLLSEAPVETSRGEPIRFAREDPPGGIRLEKQETCALLVIKTPCPYRFFGNRKNL